MWDPGFDQCSRQGSWWERIEEILILCIIFGLHFKLLHWWWAAFHTTVTGTASQATTNFGSA